MTDKLHKFFHAFGFHRWGNWIAAEAEMTSIFFKGTKDIEVQVRFCKICNKREID